MSCSICLHAQASEINAALTIGNEGTRPVADRFGLSKSSVDRHKQRCILKRSDPSPSADPSSIPPSAPPASVEEPIEVTPCTDRAPTFRGVPGPGRACKVCQHPKRLEIEQAVYARRSHFDIAREFLGGPNFRHNVAAHVKSGHCQRDVRLAHAETNVARVVQLAPVTMDLERRREIARDQLERILVEQREWDDKLKALDKWRAQNPDKASEYEARRRAISIEQGKLRSAYAQISGADRGLVELIAKITGELVSKSELVISKHPKWSDWIRRAADIAKRITDEEVASDLESLFTEMEKSG